MMHNFIVVVLTLALLAVMGFSLKFLLDKGLFPSIEKISTFMAQRLKWRYWVISLEILFIIGLICSFILFIVKNEMSEYILFVYFIFVLFISGLIYQLKKLTPNCLSIFEKMSFNMNNYFFSRVNLFLEHCVDMSLISILVITYSFIIELKWPTYVYFVGFLVLPIYINVWIYFTKKGELRNTEITSIRRAFAYFLLVIYAIYQANILFMNVFLEKNLTILDESNLILYVAAFVFIAIERLLKALTDDYIRYKNDKQSRP